MSPEIEWNVFSHTATGRINTDSMAVPLLDQCRIANIEIGFRMSIRMMTAAYAMLKNIAYVRIMSHSIY